MKNIFLSVVIGIAALLVAVLIDVGLNKGLVIHGLMYSKECNYTVPAGYSIVYSQEEKMYAVKVHLYDDYYLHDGSYGIRATFSSISMPALFKDTCIAKGYLKSYVDDLQPKFK